MINNDGSYEVVVEPIGESVLSVDGQTAIDSASLDLFDLRIESYSKLICELFLKDVSRLVNTNIFLTDKKMLMMTVKRINKPKGSEDSTDSKVHTDHFYCES